MLTGDGVYDWTVVHADSPPSTELSSRLGCHSLVVVHTTLLVLQSPERRLVL